jgi:hypothetical protein
MRAHGRLCAQAQQQQHIIKNSIINPGGFGVAFLTVHAWVGIASLIATSAAASYSTTTAISSSSSRSLRFRQK